MINVLILALVLAFEIICASSMFNVSYIVLKSRKFGVERTDFLSLGFALLGVGIIVESMIFVVSILLVDTHGLGAVFIMKNRVLWIASQTFFVVSCIMCLLHLSRQRARESLIIPLMSFICSMIAPIILFLLVSLLAKRMGARRLLEIGIIMTLAQLTVLLAYILWIPVAALLVIAIRDLLMAYRLRI